MPSCTPDRATRPTPATSATSARTAGTAAAAATLVTTAIAVAAIVQPESLRLIGNDTVAEDNFGHTVAVDGSLAVVGAINEDNQNGNAAGSVYVFDLRTGTQTRKLIAPDGNSSDTYGDSLDLDGTIAAIGAPRHDEPATISGAVYVVNVQTGQTLAKLSPIETIPASLVGQALGSSVAISESIIVSGARGDVALENGGGSVYIFERDTFELRHKIFPDDPDFADNFGFSVATSGNLVVVGTPFDDDQGDDSGSVYVFDATTGQQLRKIVPADLVADDFFGISVAIEGATLVVGAAFADDASVGPNTGRVYVFDAMTGVQLGRFASSAPVPEGRFGESVRIDGPRIAVGETLGASPDGVLIGAVAVHDRTTFDLIARLQASDGLEGDGLGQAVDIQGPRVIAGAQGVDADGNLSGAAYVFEVDDAPPPCPADLDASGTVGLGDLLAVLAAFGSADPAIDLDGSGTVDLADLLTVLSAWGPCPG